MFGPSRQKMEAKRLLRVAERVSIGPRQAAGHFGKSSPVPPAPAMTRRQREQLATPGNLPCDTPRLRRRTTTAQDCWLGSTSCANGTCVWQAMPGRPCNQADFALYDWSSPAIGDTTRQLRRGVRFPRSFSPTIRPTRVRGSFSRSKIAKGRRVGSGRRLRDIPARELHATVGRFPRSLPARGAARRFSPGSRHKSSPLGTFRVRRNTVPAAVADPGIV